jgi:hypothetical protein
MFTSYLLGVHGNIKMLLCPAKAGERTNCGLLITAAFLNGDAAGLHFFGSEL